MHKYHRQILEEVKARAGKHDSEYLELYQRSVGTSHLVYALSVPKTREISKKWAGKLKDSNLEELLELLNSLYKGESREEKKIASQLLQYLPKLRAQLNPKDLGVWLKELEGWEEIDTLCQSVFTADELLSKWNIWKKLLKEFAESKSLSHKRASLVLLTAPVTQAPDKRLAGMAFENIDKLKPEKSILITKAISWLLRSLIKNHKQEVDAYLEKNLDSLPKVAIRETRNKLQTGRK